MKKNLNHYLKLPYQVEVTPLPEDEGGGYYAKFTDFPPASAHGDGPTVEKAILEARISLKLVLEDMLEQGLSIPEPLQDFSGKFNLRVPKSLHRALVRRAEREGVSLNMLAVKLLSEGVVQ